MQGVLRHYFDPTPLNAFNPLNPMNASQVFWQAGMGTAFGPFVIGSSSFYQCVVNDTMQYDASNSGLPGTGGAGQLCWVINTATPDMAFEGPARMSISPNPADDRLTIELAGKDAHLGGRLALIDPTGRAVLTLKLDGPLMRLDVAAFHGFYIVVMELGSGRLVGKVVIQ